MNYINRTFRLEGPTGLGRYPRPDLIGPLLTRLPETLQDSVRMSFLHSSRPNGRISDALKAAAEVRLVKFTGAGANGTVITFRVPRLGDAAPSLYKQGEFWDDSPSPDSTAFDLLGKTLDDINGELRDSPRFDQPLLKRIGAYGRILNHGLSRIVINEESSDLPPQIDSDVVERAKSLSMETPAPRRVRVAGRLDLMGASQGVLKVHLHSNVTVTALWTGPVPIEQHRELFNRDVVVEGIGVFRPSGTLLRIEADAIVPATEQAEFFRELPTAIPVGRDYSKAARLRPGEKSAFAVLRGSLPAEESDDDFIAALEAIR